MKKIFYTFLVAFAFLSFSLISKKETNHGIHTIQLGETLPIGDKVLQGIDGKTYSTKSLIKENGLLVIFSACECPFVVGSNDDNEGWQTRYNKIYEIAETNGIGMTLINSNEAKRNNGDSFEDMKTQAESQSYKMPYLLDTGHVLADAFGAKFTPHVFLFNQSAELVYIGAIDDNVKNSKAVENKYLENALNALSKGEKIDPSETRAMGCSIKRTK